MKRNDEGVEARILADLRPVRPLARPWKRGLAVCGVAALAAAGVTGVSGVRADAPLLGPGVLWGLSAAQGLYGLALIAAALRESVPGRGLSRGSAPLLIAGAAGLVLVVSWLTWTVHPSVVPAGDHVAYWHRCFPIPVLVGLPSLVVALLLAFRAYPTRPALVGALAGLGAGLLADGSWRTYCEVTAPAHVLSSHLAAVLVLTLLGLLAAVVAGARTRR